MFTVLWDYPFAQYWYWGGHQQTPTSANGQYFSLAWFWQAGTAECSPFANTARKRRHIHGEIHNVHTENRPATPGLWQSPDRRRQWGQEEPLSQMLCETEKD